MNTMTTTSVLSLGIALWATFIFGTGCSTLMSTDSDQTPGEVELSRIPDKLNIDEESAGRTPPKEKVENPNNESGETLDKSQKPHALAGDLMQKEDGLYYVAVSDKPFTGVALLLHENGKPHFEGQFKNGYRVGEGVEWDKDGHKRYEGEWKRTPNHTGSRLYTGKVYYYYARTDTLKLKGEYFKGVLISGQNLDRSGNSY